MMKNELINWFGYLSFFVLLLFSCSGTGTELTQKRIDDSYKGRPVSDILVIAITGNEHNRRVFEKKFVSQLKSVGIDAVSSEEAMPMPADLELKKEDILKAVNQYENDAVIITHLIGKAEKDVYTRGGSPHGGFYGFYRSRYSYAHDPGYSSTNTTVRLETNLYDVKTEKLIWSGKSNSWSNEAKDQIINDVIKAVVAELKNNKLIAPK
ncbi:MAG: hypothetical protein PVH37_28175 [Desulfobacterales bacterium]|jgi:hypothetical protein